MFKFLKDKLKDWTSKISKSEEIEEKPKKTKAVKKEKKTNEDVCPVFDLDAQGWRSFRWDSIKSVSFTIGDQNG